MKRPKRYNHAYTVAFTVVSEHGQSDVTVEELRAGLLQRIVCLEQNPEEWQKACAPPYDTYEVATDSEWSEELTLPLQESRKS